MSFLWPYAWIFSLLAIPIVIFYLIRTLPKRRPVSTLLFWEQIQPQLRSSPLWRKLRRLLSLLLQLLFLFLLIFLIAQPLLPWQQKEPATVVYVIDTSASMQATDGHSTSIEKAREMLNTRIINLRASDEALIIAAGKTPQVLQRWTANRSLLLQSLQELQVDPDEGDLGSALDLAIHLAEQREEGRIVLFSDGVISDTLAYESGAPVEIVPLTSSSIPNIGITEFSARRSRLDRHTILIRLRVVQSGTGPTPQEPAKLELTINGQLTDVLPLAFEHENVLEKIWRIPLKEAARIEARILNPSPDSIPTDNLASLVIDPVETLSVRLVSRPNPFLEAILASLEGIEATRIAPESLPTNPEEARYIFYQTTAPGGGGRPGGGRVGGAGAGGGG
ncbi:MAG: vWA domain-containing protein, partial [Puniceicoccales bacterium]